MKSFWKSVLAGAVCLTVAAGTLGMTAFAEADDEHILSDPVAYDTWENAYTDVLNTRRAEYPYFSLLDVDGDEIPELILHEYYDMSARPADNVRMYSFYDGMLYDCGKLCYLGFNTFAYDPTNHVIYTGYDEWDDVEQLQFSLRQIFELSHGTIRQISRAETYRDEDGNEVSNVNGVVYDNDVEAGAAFYNGLNYDDIVWDYGNYENTPENVALYLQVRYSGWRDGFAEILRTMRGTYDYFSLRYIDDDDIPELIIHDLQGSEHPHAAGNVRVYSYYDGTIYEADTMCDNGSNTFTYEERTGYIRTGYIGTGYWGVLVYKLSEGQFELVHSMTTEGTAEFPEYIVDGVSYTDLDEATAAVEYDSHDWTHEYGDYENTDANIQRYLSDPNQPTNPNPNPTPNPNNTNNNTNNNTTNNTSNTNAVKTGDTGLAPLAMLIPAGLLAFVSRKRKHDEI